MKQREKALTVELMCGLCNRLRAIEGAIVLSDEIGARTRFFWFCNSDLNAKFSDLFEPLEFEGSIREVSLPPYAEVLVKRFIHGVERRWSDRYLRELEIEAMLEAGYDFRELGVHRRIFMKTWNRVRPSVRPYSMFRPVDRLRRIIDSYRPSEGTLVGIHIRRTDHPVSTVASTTEGFLAEMRKAIARHGDVRFFLATDDLAEEERVKQEFPGLIVSHRKSSVDRDNRSGIEDAVIDLYSLGNCEYVIGSAESSFTHMAASLTGKDLIIARNHDGAAVRAAPFA